MSQFCHSNTEHFRTSPFVVKGREERISAILYKILKALLIFMITVVVDPTEGNPSADFGQGSR
jgi:hypothetical protein